MCISKAMRAISKNLRCTVYYPKFQGHLCSKRNQLPKQELLLFGHMHTSSESCSMPLLPALECGCVSSCISRTERLPSSKAPG